MPVLIFSEKEYRYLSTPEFTSVYPCAPAILPTVTLSKQWQHTSYSSLSIMHKSGTLNGTQPFKILCYSVIF